MAGHRVEDQLVDGRYARVEQIGRGGFGVVWRAHDTLLQRDVAIKEIEFPAFLDEQEQAALREKVLREARAAARLSHPSLVTVFDVVEEDRRPFIVMELVDAPTLADRVANDGPLSDQEAAAIGEQVLDALTTAHAHGIIHRDVKPPNVMVSDAGRVQLGDFGIASIIDDPKVTSSGHLAGSPSYMAPEQAQNRQAGPATDLWGLAATLYFAVEGTPPFAKDGAIPTLTSVVADDPRPIQRATALAPLLRALLVKDPAARPAVADVRRRLAEVAHAAAPSPPPSASPEETLEFDADQLSLPEPLAQPTDPALEPAPPVTPPTAPVIPAPAPEPAATIRPAPMSTPDPPAPAPPVRPATSTQSRPAPLRQARGGNILALALAAVLAVVVVAFFASRSAPSDSTPAQPSPPGSSSTATRADEADEATDAQDVPASWVSYQDPATGFSVSRPSSWTVQRSGTLTDFREPKSGAYLRVDYTSSPGPSPEQAWYDLERRFAAENPNYQRVRIAATTFKGYPAAVWEYTYTGRGVPLRAVDLGFVTPRYGFALNFQTRAREWEDMQDVFQAFKASFQPPGG